MSQHNDIGKQGEKIAFDYLVHTKQFIILETNWRFSRAEIDIIAKNEETLIFIEVKTRSYDYFGKPEDFVSRRKEELVQDAANEYMKQINHNWAIRFDIISVLMNKDGTHSLEHFEDAWW